MLLSDAWQSQPAVLQLLPFSANHALSLAHSDGSSSSPRGLRHQRQANMAPANADTGREFPVLAVTRGQGTAATTSTATINNNYNSNSRSGFRTRVSSHGGPNPDPPDRCASERLPRPAHALLQSQFYRSSGTHSARVSSHETEPLTGYHLRDQDGDLLGYITGSDAFMKISENEAGEEKNGRNLAGGLLPKPVFQLDDVGPACTMTSTFAGSAQCSPAQEGRLALSHRQPGGLRRSLTLTPGELQLQKHRQQMDRASSSRQQLTASPAIAQHDAMHGHHYHKLNIRDLPRSTTPVHDHDPDRLNMKQVIAFLQSKGKSHAEAVELPRELRAKVAQDVQLLTSRRSAQGQLKGRVRRPSLLPSSSSSTTSPAVAAGGPASGTTRHASPTSLRSSTNLQQEPIPATIVPSADHDRRDYANFVCPLTFPGTRSSTELKPESRATATAMAERSRLAGRAVSEYTPRPTGESADSVRSGLKGDLVSPSAAARRKSSKSKSAGARSQQQQQQKKPFRLHRFLTMVPSPRDSAPPGFAATGASSPHPTTHAVPEAVSRATTHKERTLCLDLANQSRSLASHQRGKTADWETQAKARKGSFDQNGNDGDYCGNGGSSKVRYRISAVGNRSRPGSLRSAEEAAAEPHHKVTSDHNNLRDEGGWRVQIQDDGNQPDIHSFDYRNNAEDTKIIRLPYVMVDPEDDENATLMGGKASLIMDHTHSADRSRVYQHLVNKSHQSVDKSSSEQNSLYKHYEDAGNLKAYENNISDENNNGGKARLTDHTNELISNSYQKQCEPAENLTTDLAGQSASSLTVSAIYSISLAQSSASEDLSPYFQTEGKAQQRVNAPDTKALTDAASAFNADHDSALSLSTQMALPAGSGSSVDSGSGVYGHSRDNFTASAVSFAGNPSTTTSVVSMMATVSEQGRDEQTEQPVRWKDTSSDTRFPSIPQSGKIDVGLDNIFRDLQPKVTKKVKVNVPSARARPVTLGEDTWEQKTDCVTLSLRKERHRTRESTYMSEIGDRDASSENCAAVRMLSCVRSNVRSDLASDGSPSDVS